MNIFDIPEINSSKEISEVILKGKDIKIEKIISTGQISPDGFWYDQEIDEWVVLIQGEAILNFGNNIVSMKKGDSLLIPAHQKHRIEKTSIDPCCIWLCIFANFNK